MTPRNEPAFPVSTRNPDGPDVQYHTTQYPGMTLRDWFAGMAMQSLIADDPNWSHAKGARMAYEAADSMLAEREKATGKGEGK